MLDISPLVMMPPGMALLSNNITEQPHRAAHTAAATPEGPPPATSTSAFPASGKRLAGSVKNVVSLQTKY